MKLPALLDEVSRCTLCMDHLPLGPRPVLQVAREARILVAGQAPGRRVLTLLLGRWAQRWHLDAGSTGVTELVRNWRRHRGRDPVDHGV